MAYAPRISDIEHILHVLLACADPQHQQHKAALAELNKCRSVATFAPCAAAVFCGAEAASQAPANIRELAGIELKNAMKSAERRQQVPPAALQYIQASSEAMLCHAQHSLRRTSASIICSMLNGRHICDVPSLLPCLLALLQSADDSHRDGGLYCLSLIVSDYPSKLSHDKLHPQLAIQLLMAAAEYTAAPTPHLRCYACDVFKEVFICLPQGLQPVIPQLISRFIQCCSDPVTEVRSRACECIKNAIQFHSEFALSQLPAILHAAYVMTQQDSDLEVRKSASDIWTTCCSQCEPSDGDDEGPTFSSALIPLLKQYAPSLIGTLLDGMAYSEIDLQQIQAELRDAAKLHGNSVAPGLLSGDCADDDGDDDEDGDGGDLDPEEEWTLRKACAKSLDELSKLIGSAEFFSVLAQQLSARMQSSDWRHQECALLAIGAVAPGCDKAIVATGALSGIFAHVVQVLQQPQPHFLITTIGCWTISRLSAMFAADKAAVHRVLAVLCNYLGSENPKVREGAVSAIATIIESCRSLSCPGHIEEILPQLSHFLGLCIQSYHGRNFLIALDATEQLAMCCSLAGSASAIVPPLMHRWSQFAQLAAAAAYDPSEMGASGGDMSVPLLRSLTCVFNSVGHVAFAPFLEAVVHPAVLRIAAAVATDGESEYYDEDGVWDGFLSNFVEFLENILLYPGAQITDVIIRHDVLSCITRLLSVPAALADVFALIGAASAHHAAFMAAHAAQLLQFLVSKFDNYATDRYKNGAISQNSLWAAGKLLVAFANMRLPLVADASLWAVVLQHVLGMISKYALQGQNDRTVSLILVNAITAVYRIALVHADAVFLALAQCSDCANVLAVISSAPLNPKLFPVATTAAAAAADDHDLAVCGRGCVMLLSKAAASPNALPSFRLCLPKFLKIVEDWRAGPDAALQPQIAAVLAQLLPVIQASPGQ